MDDPFEDHFEDLWRVAYRVAFRLVGRASDVESIAAETLVDALVSWSKITNPEGWVATVAARKAMRAVPAGRALGTPTASQVGVDAERVDLVRALGRLPRRQRQAVVLRYVADLSESAVAAYLGVSVSAVKTHTARALEALRLHLAANPAQSDGSATPKAR